jgi:hypothetical protein
MMRARRRARCKLLEWFLLPLRWRNARAQSLRRRLGDSPSATVHDQQRRLSVPPAISSIEEPDSQHDYEAVIERVYRDLSA